MKSESGVTLISITVYLIVMTIVIGIIAIISSFFYKNTIEVSEISPITEFTKFNSYFTREINNCTGAGIIDCENRVETDGYNYVIFENGNVQYTFVKENHGIYRNNVKICRDVESCTFEFNEVEKTVTVNMKVKNDLTEKEPSVYTLKGDLYY